MNAYELADELSKYTINDGVNDLNKKTINMLRQLAKQKEFLQNQSSELAKEVMYFQEQNRQQANRIAELEKKSEPVAWMWSEDGCDLGVCLEQDKKLGKKEFAEFDIPLYTTPQTKPLSDEEIWDKANQNRLTDWLAINPMYDIENQKKVVKQRVIDFGRAIEAKVRGQ